MCDHSNLQNYCDEKIKFYCYISTTNLDKDLNIYYNCKLCDIKENINYKIKNIDHKIELEKKADYRSLNYIKVISRSYEILETSNIEYLVLAKILNYYKKYKFTSSLPLHKKLEDYSLKLQMIKNPLDDFLDYINKIILMPAKSRIIYNYNEIMAELLTIYNDKLQKITNIIKNINTTINTAINEYSKLMILYLEYKEPQEIEEFMKLISEYYSITNI